MGKASREELAREEIDRRIVEMPNKELLETTICASCGDDYDGCFTKMGEYEFGVLKTEMSRRLIECGFIETAIGEE